MTNKLLKLAASLLLITPAIALAAVPSTISFSARIGDNGRPVTGLQSFTFTFWTVEAGGTPGTDDVWTESRTLTVSDGVVATSLGDVANGGTALPVFTGAPLFLEVTMGTTTFSPRIALQSVPYAFRASQAEFVPWTGVVGRPAVPGVKQVTQYVVQTVTTTTTQLASLTANIPAAGFVMVTAQGEFSNATVSTYTFCTLREDGANINNGFDWDPGDVDGWFDQQQTRTEVKAVAAGTHTYTLHCNMSSGTASIWGASLVVTYFPATL